MVCPFFSQVSLGGGMPVASQAKVTGLLMISITRSSAGPSILGGTERVGRKKDHVCLLLIDSSVNNMLISLSNCIEFILFYHTYHIY